MPGTRPQKCVPGDRRGVGSDGESKRSGGSQQWPFRPNGVPLESVLEFKYLGRVLISSDDEWPEVVGNLRKAGRRWAQMLRILGCEG